VHLPTDDNARSRPTSRDLSDPTYDKFFSQSFGIGTRQDRRHDRRHGDARTIYHAERVLQRFRPSVMAITLLDVRYLHADFTVPARPAARRRRGCPPWDFIQADAELRDTTTMSCCPSTAVTW